MSAREKIAYLKGILDAERSEDAAALPVYRAILEALTALADENDELRSRAEEQKQSAEELYSLCEDLDADLSDVEARLGIHDELAEEDLSSEDEEEYVEAQCPECGLSFFCRLSALSPENTVRCPDCGAEAVMKTEESPEDDSD